MSAILTIDDTPFNPSLCQPFVPVLLRQEFLSHNGRGKPLGNYDTLVTARVSRRCNVNLDIAVQPIQQRKQALHAKTLKIAIL